MNLNRKMIIDYFVEQVQPKLVHLYEFMNRICSCTRISKCDLELITPLSIDFQTTFIYLQIY